ncbi:MAG: hypothetical protein E2O68_09300 [Deltaproteobacteria bacterium]|nr:MAG: hypothetical protein E2O68_09300 [Deltaproteobacteria bacterium]
MIRLTILLLLLGCVQDYNSSSGDRERFSPRPVPTSSGDPRLANAYNVIEKNCLTCHLGFHNQWASNTTDQAWKSTGLVIPGDPFSSRLITKLQNVGGNMPFQSPPLSEDDLNTLVEWINLME